MRKFSTLLCAVVLISTSQIVNAVPLSGLLNGGSLIVDDKIFFDWNLVSLVFTDPDSEPDFDLIEVTPLDDQPLNPGIRFEANGELVVTDDNFLDLAFTFRVATLNPSLHIKDNSLKLDQFQFDGDGGIIAIVEKVFDRTGAPLAEKFVQADQRDGLFDLFDTKTFAPQRELLVEKDIFLAGDFQGDSVRLDAFEQRFSQISEPVMLMLFVLGLSTLAVARQQRWMRR